MKKLIQKVLQCENNIGEKNETSAKEPGNIGKKMKLQQKNREVKFPKGFDL